MRRLGCWPGSGEFRRRIILDSRRLVACGCGGNYSARCGEPMRVSLHGLAQATASESLVPMASILSGAYAACQQAGGVMDNQGNCSPNPAIINPTQQSCLAAGGSWDATAGRCTSTLPEGYNPATGAVSPSNVTGTTQTVPQSTVELNAQLQATCLAAGGTWDPVNGCSPTPSNNTALYVLGGVAAFLVLMMFLKR